MLTYRIVALALVVEGLGGCAPHIETRYVTTYCLTPQQFSDLKAKEPGKVHSLLTGQADRDLELVAGNDIRLRAYSDGLLLVLGGCVSK